MAEGTRRLLGETFDLRSMGALEFKGVPKPITCFEVIRERSVHSRFDAHQTGAPLPMVGRDGELAIVRERWRRATAGEGQAVLVAGEAGIGKSRLVRAVIDDVDPDGRTVLRCQCSPHHSGTPLWPVVQQLTFAASFEPADTDAERRTKLEKLLRRGTMQPDTALPFIGHLLGMDADSSAELTPRQLRDRTLSHLVEQVLGLARQQPVLLVVEDLHWIDPTTLELLSRLLDQICNVRVLIVLTSRPDQPPLGEAPHLALLTLNRLDTRVNRGHHQSVGRGDWCGAGDRGQDRGTV